jgi:DnaJ-domain-containing protein 1
VDGFIDRFAEFLRSLFSEDGKGAGGRPPGGQGRRAEETRFRDPDVQNAWEELDEYMRGTTGETAGGRGESAGGRRESRSAGPRRPVDESLRPDYANLEVPFGADTATVMKSYKSLIIKYHPDKHAADPEKQKLALDITKRINQSYERIRSRHQGGTPSS